MSTSEPEEGAFKVKIQATHNDDGDGGTVTLSTPYLGLNPYLLMTLREDGEDMLWEVASGGGVPAEDYGDFLDSVIATLNHVRENVDKAVTEVVD